MVTEKTRKTILDAFMALVAEQPWDQVTMPAVAERAGVKPSTLRTAYDTRHAMLADFYRRIDVEVLDGTDPDMNDEPAIDRLFDVLMRRLDALAPYKPALRSLAAAARRDPFFAAELNALALTSQRWMLTAARIPSSGVRGFALTQVLVVAFVRVLGVWMEDEDPGKARTMAALDTELRRGASALARLDRAERLFEPLKRAFAARREAASRTPRAEAEAAPEAKM